VDTSGNYLTVVAGKGGEFYSVSIPNCMMKHSVSVMPAVDEVLKKANMTLAECDFFSAVVGAGSFTGIRIGISVVKGFCLAYKKPSLPVTSFDVAAYNRVSTGKILCLVDALHDAYYACGYENGEVVCKYVVRDTSVDGVSDGGWYRGAGEPDTMGGYFGGTRFVYGAGEGESFVGTKDKNGICDTFVFSEEYNV
jgi:tRNA threonylcarbamoyl adenosine modification protein YeaZ